VTGQFLDHQLAIDLAFAGMMKDVQPDKSGEQLPMAHDG
jgi:hypothetical protein